VDFLQGLDSAVISNLSVTQMRSLLGRSRRMEDLSVLLESVLFAALLDDIDRGWLQHYPLDALHLELDALHLEVLVISPHNRISLASTKLPRHLQVILNEVHWISLEELSQQPDLDPLFNLPHPAGASRQ